MGNIGLSSNHDESPDVSIRGRVLMFRASLTLLMFLFATGSAVAEAPLRLAQYQVLETEAASSADNSSVEESIESDADAFEAADPETYAEEEPAVETAEPLVLVDPEYRFSAIKSGGELAVRGHVPNSGARLILGNVVGSPNALTDIEINTAAPQGFVESLSAGLAALEHLERGQVAFARGAWLLSGYATVDTHKAAALEIIARLDGGESWQVMVTAPRAIDVCQAAVEEFMGGKAILFASGSARLTADSEALLSNLADLFGICPDAAIFIEGHTDSDGGDAANLVLSVARAEAVADGLVALGLAPDRLYAVGYGASLPIASNATNEGKRQNRRIVFSFEDAAD